MVVYTFRREFWQWAGVLKIEIERYKVFLVFLPLLRGWMGLVIGGKESVERRIFHRLKKKLAFEDCKIYIQAAFNGGKQ